MNREIKFRGWDNHNKEWVYSKPMPDMGFWKWVSYDSTTIFNQYTGLKDMNEREIYEGDIVRFQENYIQPVKVEWNDEMTGFYPLLSVISIRLKVIGNIHENPELL